MYYKSIYELPYILQKKLPVEALELYKARFNAAWQDYIKIAAIYKLSTTHDEFAMKAAWAAIRSRYKKNEFTGKWHEIFKHEKSYNRSAYKCT